MGKGWINLLLLFSVVGILFFGHRMFFKERVIKQVEFKVEENCVSSDELDWTDGELWRGNSDVPNWTFFENFVLSKTTKQRILGVHP